MMYLIIAHRMFFLHVYTLTSGTPEKITCFLCTHATWLMEKRSSWTTARLGIMPPGISRSTATNVVNQAPL